LIDARQVSPRFCKTAIFCFDAAVGENMVQQVVQQCEKMSKNAGVEDYRKANEKAPAAMQLGLSGVLFPIVGARKRTRTSTPYGTRT
jgi:hypothetical protein